jgi:putative solute:sodium symporter small subunit
VKARHLKPRVKGDILSVSTKHKEYWGKLLSLTFVSLAIWFVVTFVIGYFARELSSITFMGWTFPFYMGAQGSLIIYVLIIWFYARRMNQLDHEYGVQEEEEE